MVKAVDGILATPGPVARCHHDAGPGPEGVVTTGEACIGGKLTALVDGCVRTASGWCVYGGVCVGGGVGNIILAPWPCQGCRFSGYGRAVSARLWLPGSACSSCAIDT